jgi:hypothetical protein
MPDIKLIKSWKITETLLERARRALLDAARGGFWRDLERAAENMGLVDRLPALIPYMTCKSVRSNAPLRVSPIYENP